MTKQNGKWKLSDFDAHIRPEHLKGQRITLEISHASVEEFHNDKGKADTKPTLHFRGTKKDLPLSNPNRRTLMALIGDDPDALEGKCVILEAQQVKAFGKEVPAVRIVGRDLKAEQTLAAKRAKLPGGQPLASVSENVERETSEQRLTELYAEAKEMGWTGTELNPQALTDEALTSELAKIAAYIGEHREETQEG